MVDKLINHNNGLIMIKSLIALIVVSLPTTASVYKCESPDGSLEYQGTPCDENEKTTIIEQQASQSVSASEGPWELISRIDPMTDKKACIIESPSNFLGEQGNDFLFARVRMKLTPSGNYIVGIYTENPLSTTNVNGASFHYDINGLGLRVDSNHFIPVASKASDYVLGFSPQDSDILASEFLNGRVIKLRVRYWPYDKTYDGRGISLSSYRQALQQLHICSNIPLPSK